MSAFAVIVDWTPFVVDDIPLEWSAYRTSLRETLHGRAFVRRIVLVSVRYAGDSSGGAGQVLPEGAVPTVVDAVATYRRFATTLAANDRVPRSTE